MTENLLWPAAKVRSTFIEFFKSRAHTVVPSASVVPQNDKTLLFINSGMAQFKSLFLGTADRSTDYGKMKRAVDSQLCIRAGGKHNDLDDVGKDTYHHTLFEMVGNWSFGDYYKKDAIEWAWELLTEVFKLPKERLYVTYFEGDPRHGLAADEEAREVWRKLLPDARILKGNAKDNFWEMGDTGPCGPCTEIHYDHIGGRDAASLVNNDDPTVVEVWNLVFMQYNRTSKGGELVPLPAKHVDTGMGLERLIAALQQKRSNYDTDLWTPMFRKIQEVTKFARSYAELVASPDADTPNSPSRLAIVAYRVIADHSRCLTVALSDGAAPDNQGRGFVLRRIIRRAIRYGVQFLGAEFGFFTRLVPAVVESLGGHFTYLADETTQRRVSTLLREEEDSFAKTWRTGLKHFEKAVESSRAANSAEVNPEDVFTLHDRYGFPVDLTLLLAERENLTVDTERFKEVMKKNQVGGGRTEAAKHFFDTYQVDDLNRRQVAPTNDAAKFVWESCEARIVAIFNKATGTFLDAVPSDMSEPELIGVVLDRTNFYSEGGGQIFDTGSFERSGNLGNFEVKRCFAFGGYVVHIGDLTRGELKVGDVVTLDVDYERRTPIAINHTTTHVLNHALRDVLQFGHPDQFTEVHQKGSLVTEDYLRFDFSWNNKLSTEDIAATEKLLNAAIAAQLPVHSKGVPLAQAMNIKYLRGEFGTKYGDVVNVVCVGKSIDDLLADPQSEDNRKYSIELCGGTHIRSFDQVRRAVFIAEDSLTKGVRRATLFTGDAAAAAVAQANAFRAEFAKIKASATTDYDAKGKEFSVLAKRVGDSQIPLLDKVSIRDDLDKAQRETINDKKAAAAQMKAAATDAGKAYAEKHLAGGKGAPFAVLKLDMADREAIQAAMDAVTKGAPAGSAVSVFAVGADAAKALAIASVAQAHIDRGLNAVEWVQAACGGKGGGKPAAAQGGLNADAADAAVTAAQAYAATKLGTAAAAATSS